jgi:protein-S-isoprenylcysteine O-methyltransferase Ste14
MLMHSITDGLKFTGKVSEMKKFIPPILVFICLLGMTTVNVLFHHQVKISYPFNLLGVIFILTGLSLGISVARAFKRADTQIHTFKEPRKLVTSGSFGYTRNPIYLGLTLLLTGAAFLFGTLLSFLFPVIFFLVANFWYIPFEENNMQRIFGDDYLRYKSRVRRWI